MNNKSDKEKYTEHYPLHINLKQTEDSVEAVHNCGWYFPGCSVRRYVLSADDIEHLRSGGLVLLHYRGHIIVLSFEENPDQQWGGPIDF